MKKVFGKKLLFILILLSMSGMLFFMRVPKNPQKTNSSPSPVMYVTPTPFPFQEMTVPALRAKTYQSQLDELDLFSEQAAYTSYLTSFSSDGLKIYGLLTQPKGKMPEGGWPAIVFIHGYILPESYRTTEKYEAYVDSLASNGIVVFKIDLRGHGNSQGSPGGGYYGSDYVSDALHAYAALGKSTFIHPKKIGLWGHSMAGNIVLRALAAKPEIPAAVIWAGAVYTYTDQIAYGINDNSYRPPANTSQRQQNRQQLRELYGNPSADSWFWKLVAPTNFLEDLQGAIQIHHAVNDEVVSIEYSRNLEVLLTQAGVEHQLYEYPSGGHNLSESSFSVAMQRTVNFFADQFSL